MRCANRQTLYSDTPPNLSLTYNWTKKQKPVLCRARLKQKLLRHWLKFKLSKSTTTTRKDTRPLERDHHWRLAAQRATPERCRHLRQPNASFSTMNHSLLCCCWVSQAKARASLLLGPCRPCLLESSRLSLTRALRWWGLIANLPLLPRWLA